MQLKRLGAAYLLRHGCTAAALEVRCAIGKYRADVVGWMDAESLGAGVNHLRRWADPQQELVFDASSEKTMRKRCEPIAIVIECKQSRGDFARDNELKAKLLAEREREMDRLKKLESIVRSSEPELRSNGVFLFDAMEEWDLSKARGKGYRAGLERIARIEKRLNGKTKFWAMSRYRVADRMYLLAPAGLVKKNEVPLGWGLLESAATWKSLETKSLVELSEVPVRVVVEAPLHACPAAYRQRVLRSIAVSLTRGSVMGTNLAGSRSGRGRYTRA